MPRAVFYDARLPVADILQQEPSWTSVSAWEPLVAGESLKTVEGIVRIWDALDRMNLGRGDTVAGVGGGTVTDAVGFAASTWKRGSVRAIWMPTTLVGMIDAAHGGKTAANFHGTKNILGTFYAPEAVLVHPEWLATLPEEELLSGWFELAKHALIDGAASWRHVADITTPSHATVVPLIAQSIAIKRRIAAADPHEEGPRKALNFGHTVGHALEAWSHTHGVPMAHGRCVGHGMRCALRLGAPDVLELADGALLKWLGGPPPPADPLELWSYMAKDKKNRNHEVREVVLDRIGGPRWDVPLELETFCTVWNALHAHGTYL